MISASQVRWEGCEVVGPREQLGIREELTEKICQDPPPVTKSCLGPLAAVEGQALRGRRSWTPSPLQDTSLLEDRSTPRSPSPPGTPTSLPKRPSGARRNNSHNDDRVSPELRGTGGTSCTSSPARTPAPGVRPDSPQIRLSSQGRSDSPHLALEPGPEYRAGSPTLIVPVHEVDLNNQTQRGNALLKPNTPIAQPPTPDVRGQTHASAFDDWISSPDLSRRGSKSTSKRLEYPVDAWRYHQAGRLVHGRLTPTVAVSPRFSEAGRRSASPRPPPLPIIPPGPAWDAPDSGPEQTAALVAALVSAPALGQEHAERRALERRLASPSYMQEMNESMHEDSASMTASTMTGQLSVMASALPRIMEPEFGTEAYDDDTDYSQMEKDSQATFGEESFSRPPLVPRPPLPPARPLSPRPRTDYTVDEGAHDDVDSAYSSIVSERAATWHGGSGDSRGQAEVPVVRRHSQVEAERRADELWQHLMVEAERRDDEADRSRSKDSIDLDAEAPKRFHRKGSSASHSDADQEGVRYGSKSQRHVFVSVPSEANSLANSPRATHYNRSSTWTMGDASPPSTCQTPLPDSARTTDIIERSTDASKVVTWSEAARYRHLRSGLTGILRASPVMNSRRASMPVPR